MAQWDPPDRQEGKDPLVTWDLWDQWGWEEDHKDRKACRVPQGRQDHQAQSDGRVTLETQPVPPDLMDPPDPPVLKALKAGPVSQAPLVHRVHMDGKVTRVTRQDHRAETAFLDPPDVKAEKVPLVYQVYLGQGESANAEGKSAHDLVAGQSTFILFSSEMFQMFFLSFNFFSSLFFTRENFYNYHY
ncbi:predicted protein [Nematostella vectensis]|uniref:Uncharacterized protein n=1 Tax=Nematostella vectensis TaxID=45351 RepID=A7RTS9_NEMVE|nr:predicted protein [Nematostella vectensis]|eukprot:XP_001637146.1 predicted protein [Nematostella vectensis]